MFSEDGKSYSVKGIGTCTDTDIIIPQTYNGLPVTSIGKGVFSGCTGLTSITIPDSVTSIDDSVFEDCTGLTSVTISDSVTSIGINAFRNCTGLTSVTIPDGVMMIGSSAFYNTGYYNDESNWENGVLHIGEYLIAAKEDISGAYNVKDGIKLIAESAFSSCKGLTSITIPDSVTSIGEHAFWSCTGLMSVTIGNGVESIGNYAFRECKGLTSVTIGNGVESIGKHAFWSCTGLTSINYRGTEEQWNAISKGDYWNDGVSSDCVINYNYTGE